METGLHRHRRRLGTGGGPPENNQDESLLKDRIAKAIERNRAKMARKRGHADSEGPAGGRKLPSSRPSSGFGAYASSENRQPSARAHAPRDARQERLNKLRERLNRGSSSGASPVSSARRNPPPAPEGQEELPLLERMRQKRAAQAQSQTPASSQNRPGVRSPIANRSPVSGPTRSTPRPNTTPRKQGFGAKIKQSVSNRVDLVKGKIHYQIGCMNNGIKNFIERLQLGKWFIRLGWIFCLILLGRLVFSERGMIDFYKFEKRLEKRKTLLTQLKKENNDIRGEIKKIKSSGPYQKKIIRDRLGLIAKDEYLILFAQEKSTH